MSGSRKVKASSVAAFLFMPQFHLSYGHMRFVVPVFMRTLALSFAQAGLLPHNHPATRYGIEGVRKYSFSELMAEAWFTLRTTRATPAQWGVFVSVAGFICLMAAALISAILRFAFGMSNVAQAQIFDSALGATDQASVAGAGYTSLGMFDKSLATAGTAHAEWAISILDKMLRQGIEGNGGALQNAFGSLMQVYNTGVMVVAAVILFWIILSVVVDTAKTGVIGGGRHNMVWAPMRIVFALGLLIPLGAVGFSSGQFMVLKLAEWGSNFGTRAWVAYVGSVLTNSNMVVTRTPDNPTALATAYTEMWVCLLANNGWLEWGATSASAPDQIVQMIKANTSDVGKTSFAFTNATTGNLCGTVTYSTPREPTLLYTIAAADPFNSATATYRKEILEGWVDELFGVVTPAGGGAAFDPTFADKPFEIKSRDLACAYVAESIPNDAPYPLDIECPNGYGACSAGGIYDGDYPDAGGTGAGCMQDIVNTMYTGMAGRYAASLATLNAAITGGALIANVQQDGWAGMGIWYHKINQVNLAVSTSTQPTLQITAGEVAKASASTAGLSSSAKFAADVVADYTAWWQSAPPAPVLATAASTPANAGGRQAPQDLFESPSIATAAKSLGLSLITADARGAADAITQVIIGALTFKNFFFDVLEPNDPDIYPLAELASTGSQIMTWGIAILGGVQVLGIGIAAGGGNFFGKLVGGDGVAAAIIQGPIMEGLSTIGSLMLVVGMILAYYVPIIPFMRVAFSVLTWMISVFEAVVMVPIAALAHLTTEGEGLAGSHARNAWVLWLNVLMRPVLTVIGYVGAMLVFNTFVFFFHHTFLRTAIVGMTDNGFVGFLTMLAYSALYVATIYTVANSSFKLLDVIPNAMMRWMGGSADTSFEDSAAEGYLIAGGKMVGGMGSSLARAAGGRGRHSGGSGTGAAPSTTTPP